MQYALLRHSTQTQSEGLEIFKFIMIGFKSRMVYIGVRTVFIVDFEQILKSYPLKADY